MAAASPPPSTPLAGRQLFVGNLPYIVGWQDLKDLFRGAGDVIRADVATTPTGRSRGFGTVLMGTTDEAADAIASFNGYDWHGRKIEVREDRAVAQGNGEDGEGVVHERRPVKEQHVVPVDPNSINTRALYVGNLPWSVGWQDLKDLFRQAGTVSRADIPQDFQGRSKGFGTVAMSVVEDARKAVSMFNGFDWNGRKIEVREDRSYNESRNSGGRQLFVGNLPFTVQWQELKDLFRQCGQVSRADVATDSQGRSRGYGTVVMATQEEAQACVATLNGIQIQGRAIEVRDDKYAGDPEAPAGGLAASYPAPASVSSTNGQVLTSVFVGNLPFSTRWQDLKDLFRPFDLSPAHADIIMDNHTGRSKGCGIVRFARKEDAERAVAEVNSLEVDGRHILVRLDKFDKGGPAAPARAASPAPEPVESEEPAEP